MNIYEGSRRKTTSDHIFMKFNFLLLCSCSWEFLRIYYFLSKNMSLHIKLKKIKHSCLFFAVSSNCYLYFSLNEILWTHGLISPVSHGRIYNMKSPDWLMTHRIRVRTQIYIQIIPDKYSRVIYCWIGLIFI